MRRMPLVLLPLLIFLLAGRAAAGTGQLLSCCACLDGSVARECVVIPASGQDLFSSACANAGGQASCSGGQIGLTLPECIAGLMDKGVICPGAGTEPAPAVSHVSLVALAVVLVVLGCWAAGRRRSV